ncbi:uncharacterized protein LOC106082019 [Stomoxys calcitrans]|uniref:uncharacterized protein LOC106082019 n=1 Tax=Stomoxys calcitrans TaxID=35570 RepID=UPI0027E2543B|nr:uncharacterized protein LOC106082019 [Stomoxys calcitrans]
MSSSCLHAIKLLNLKENEIIPHRFLLLKGIVEGQKCGEPENVSLDIENTPQLASSDSSSGKFKFLLDLGVEKRTIDIKIKYCNALLELQFEYKPKCCNYALQPLLIIAQDENSNDDRVELYRQIIDLNLLLIQSVYAEKLNERSYGRLCFCFKDQCQVFVSSLRKEEIWQKSEHDLWSHFAKEILLSKWGQEDSQLKFVAFINCSRYLADEVVQTQDFSYENIRKHIQGHAACGAGGLALFSCTYFYAWPCKFDETLQCFEDKRKLDLTKEPDESNYRKTRGGVYASSLGAVCHEIGHIFDLGHDLEGVMGTNFDYINNVFIINTMTEHLPHRIVQQKSNVAKPRFTQLKKTAANGFLDCYREQKENDSFYFSPNSAIILAHHPWLADTASEVAAIDNNDFDVDFAEDKLSLVATKYSLKIIEIRTNINSVVAEWFEFQKHQQQPVFQFDIRKFQNRLKKDCHIFVMSSRGHIKKLFI